MNPSISKPDWARYLPHGDGILLLQKCLIADEHHAIGETVLNQTALGASLATWPALWGLEILAQAAASLPVHGKADGPRQGYLVKADQVRFNVAMLPPDERLRVEVERTAESSAGLNICHGTICPAAVPDSVLFHARFFLWNQAA